MRRLLANPEFIAWFQDACSALAVVAFVAVACLWAGLAGGAL